MPKQRKDVVFIRKNGRVIPIDKKAYRERQKRKKHLKEGGNLIAQGAGLAAGGSFATSLLTAREASAGQGISNAQKAAKEFFVKTGKQHGKLESIIGTLKRRKALVGRARSKMWAITLGASVLTGAGIGHLFEASGRGEDETNRELVTHGVTAGAVLLGSRSKLAGKALTKSHRFISKKLGWTSKLDRQVVNQRKAFQRSKLLRKYIDPNQMRMKL